MIRTPQVILTLDPTTGALCAEAPGEAGARRRLALPKGADAALAALRAELLAQSLRASDLAREAEVAERKRHAERQDEIARERHRYVWDMALKRHGPAFAERVVGPRRAASGSSGATSTKMSAEALGL